MSMRSSFTRQRMIRKVSKRDAVPLNLVSMIDIFTTLVFFLLLTSTSVQTIRTPPSLHVPASITTLSPNDTPLLMVTRDAISLQGKAVMSINDAEAVTSQTLAPLKSELLLVPLQKMQGGANDGQLTRGEINIMADKEIPYSLLKRVMYTCGQAQFVRISLSVNHRSLRAGP